MKQAWHSQGPDTRIKQGGFTLLEIMVVLVLIALTVGMISLNFGDDNARRVEHAAKRFAALAEQLCQESIIQGRLLAVTIDGATGYSFVMFTETGWVPVTKDDVFRPRTLPEGITMELDLLDSGRSTRHQILQCELDGRMAPFTAVFSFEDIQYRVMSNELHGLQVRAESAE